MKHFIGRARTVMGEEAHHRKPHVGKIVAILVTLTVLGGATYMWGSVVGHHLWSWLRSFNLVVVIVGLVLLVVLAVRWNKAYDKRYSHLYVTEDSGIMDRYWFLCLLALTVIIGAVAAMFAGSFLHDRAYVESIEKRSILDSQDYRERAPYGIAEIVMASTMGDTTGSRTNAVKSLPQVGENGVYQESVIRRGFGVGYESTVSVDVPLAGAASAKNTDRCSFDDEASLRFGGALPQNNLSRAIYNKTSPSVIAEKEDAFTVCDGVHPMVYVPLTELKGWPISHRVPAGVAIYNGSTGELTIQDEYEGELPVYPSSVAEQQREAYNAGGSFFDWLFGRFGFETTEDDNPDDEGNVSEISISSQDGESGYYMTPLTSRGSSTSILAFSSVPHNEVKAGELSESRIYAYESGKSMLAKSNVSSAVKSQLLQSSHQTVELKVHEFIPSSNGSWIASVGTEQAVIYRVFIDQEQTVKVVDAKTGAVIGEQEKSSAATDKPVSEMTDEELEQIVNDAVKELARRAGEE